MFDIPLNQFRSVFAHNFFVAPSDRNYFLARFSKTYGIYEEFWWQALQTIEKLFKAGLILNGVSVKNGYSHDIKKLWQKHKEVFEDLAVKNLRKPDRLSERCWDDRPLEDLIDRINRMGHPDSRYGLISYENRNGDLFRFDQLVFELRRRTIGLDWIVGDDFPDDRLTEFYGQPYRYVIARRPELQIRTRKAVNGSFSVIGEDLEDVVYSWNIPFLRNSADLERPAPPSVAPRIAGFRNSYLYFLWDKLNSTEITAHVRERVEWLLDNVKVGRDAECELKILLAE